MLRINQLSTIRTKSRIYYWPSFSDIRSAGCISIYTRTSQYSRTMGSTSPPPLSKSHEWSAPRVRQTFLDYFQKKGHTFGMCIEYVATSTVNWCCYPVKCTILIHALLSSKFHLHLSFLYPIPPCYLPMLA